MKKLYELGPNSEVAEPGDIPVVPTNVSAFGNDVGYVARYALIPAVPEYSGTTASVALRDRASNDVDLTGHESVTRLKLAFPPLSSSGWARDFFLRLTVDSGASSPPTVELPAGATIDFGADALASIDVGLNLLLFSEIAANHWLVSAKEPEA